MLITRCPNCDTTFRVRMEQLNLRAGRVRCGHCHVPFSALASLEELPDEAATTQLGQRAQAPQTPVSPAAPHSTPAPTEIASAEPMDAAATVIVPTELIEPVDLPPTPRALYRQEPAKPSTETARAVPLDQDGEDFNLDFDTDDLNASPAPQANANRSQNSSKPASPQQEPVDGDREFIELGTPADDDADAFDQEFERNLGIGSANDGIDDDSDIRDDDDSGDSMPQLHTVFLDEDIPPGAAVDPALRAARAKQRRSLVMGCILLLLTGLVLATYVLRIELARLYPGLRAPLEQACQYFSCDVPYPRDADEVLLVGSDLTQATDPKGGYHLAITVRNHARYPVAWPQLEITLTDRFERALTRRVLEPKEWLPANVAQHPAFEAQGELTAQITLASDSQVMGYRLGVFYR